MSALLRHYVYNKCNNGDFLQYSLLYSGVYDCIITMFKLIKKFYSFLNSGQFWQQKHSYLDTQHLHVIKLIKVATLIKHITWLNTIYLSPQSLNELFQNNLINLLWLCVPISWNITSSHSLYDLDMTKHTVHCL